MVSHGKGARSHERQHAMTPPVVVLALATGALGPMRIMFDRHLSSSRYQPARGPCGRMKARDQAGESGPGEEGREASKHSKTMDGGLDVLDIEDFLFLP